MKFVLVVVGLIALSYSASARIHSDAAWEEYKMKHGKVYNDAETEIYRRGIWLENVKKIETHNKRYEAGEVSYFLGLNHMSDMTKEERKQFNTYRASHKKNSSIFGKSLESSDLPKSVDWRKQGAVNPIKNQQQCGSCWAFSAVASLEGQYFLKNKKLVQFSEQQLVDCVSDAHGCHGGAMDLAFDYVLQVGIESEKAYPYNAMDQTCAYDKSKVLLPKITTYSDIASGDEQALQQAIATVGPISIAIDAQSDDFNFYQGGLYDNPDGCGNQLRNLDHGVAVVGYGITDDGKEYYIVRNSWGQDWGEQGYIRMSRNKDNQCGIATMASYPLL